MLDMHDPKSSMVDCRSLLRRIRRRCAFRVWDPVVGTALLLHNYSLTAYLPKKQDSICSYLAD